MQVLVAEAWCPVSGKAAVQRALRQASEQASATVSRRRLLVLSAHTGSQCKTPESQSCSAALRCVLHAAARPWTLKSEVCKLMGQACCTYIQTIWSRRLVGQAQQGQQKCKSCGRSGVTHCQPRC